MIRDAAFDKLVGVALENYHIERFIGRSKIGPAYLARVGGTTAYLLRFLEIPALSTPGERGVYLEHFLYRARQIATLQHPHLLSLHDFGIYRDLPYLVAQHIPLRSLRTRLGNKGGLNTFTVGRYLDQIAAALEYTHEHSVIHGSLSVDSIFIRLDGQLVIADTGVRSLFELDSHLPAADQLFTWGEGCAPEQLQGKPAGPASDVYALGAIAYHLLAGGPVFGGDTPDEIAQQHLYASPPPLTQRRSDLPAELYGVLARALAKDPAQRFRQPGAFANAYHDTVAPANRSRLPFVVSEVSPSHARESKASMANMQFAEYTRSAPRSAVTEAPSGAARSALQPSTAHSLHGFSHDSLIQDGGPRPALMRRFGRKNRQRTLLIASLVALLVLASGAIGIALLTQKSGALSGASGQAIFFSNQDNSGGQTNSLRITIQNLQVPAAGDAYYAWIIDDQTEGVVSLGELAQRNQTWSLTHSGGSENLLAAGDKLEVTLEHGEVQVPAGKVILLGTFPVKSFAHILHLLVSFPKTPGKIGFLVGLLEQTHLLDTQAAVLQSVAPGQNTIEIECVTQSMLDIIEGTHGARYRPLEAVCSHQNVTAVGDGFGLLDKGYVADAEQHAALALSQPDATSIMRQHAALMDAALSNINSWVTTIEQDVSRLQSHPNDLAPLQEITALADDSYHGVDANGDGQIDPVPGEAGAITAFQQGQLMATLSLIANA